jgi:hypothetical protein
MLPIVLAVHGFVKLIVPLIRLAIVVKLLFYPLDKIASAKKTIGDLAREWIGIVGSVPDTVNVST